MRRRYLRNRARGNIIYPGLIAAWSAKGKSNDDKDRATLKDLTGNGHDITLNGFAFSGMSGYGGYVNDLIKTKYSTVSNNIVTIISNEGTGTATEITTFTPIKGEKGKTLTYTRKAFDIKISNLPNGINFIVNFGKNNGNKTEWEMIGNFVNGINHVDEKVITVEPYDSESTPYVTDCRILFSTELASVENIADLGITIELLPEYPDAIVFDGVNDYGINENMPILTDYTIIAKRKTNDGLGALLSKAENTVSAFVFEGGSKFVSSIFSFGFGNKMDIINSDISYQSKNKYNGITIGVGPAIDTNKIVLGRFRFWQGAFYSAYLFDRSLDEQEIKAFIRKYIDPEYLLPSEIPTPDCYYDFSKGSNNDETRDTIKDYSGNGNDAVAHNFAWNEEGSGYKDGALYFDGVNDYVSLNAFDSGFKTMFIECSYVSLSTILYDQRKVGTEQEDYINTSTYEAGFYGRNKSGKTYINGVYNKPDSTLIASKLSNKHILITSIFKGDYTSTPCIASSNVNKGAYCNTALYKLLGFKEALTEEQIQVVIKKYNLLDGVDEIEVS